MSNKQITLMVVLFVFSGFALAICAFESEQQQQSLSEDDQHWLNSVNQVEQLDQASVNQTVDQKLEQYVRQQIGAAQSGSGDQEMQIPDACLSGLPGLDLNNPSSDLIREEMRQVRSLIQQDALAKQHVGASSENPGGHSGFQNNARIPASDQEFRGAVNSPPQPNSRVRNLPRVNDLANQSNHVQQANLQGQVQPSQDGPVSQASFDNYNPHAKTSHAKSDVAHQAANGSVDPNCFDPHADLYRENEFPSATQCAKCHEQIFDEWASSSHAYASISPMFQKFEQKINDLAQGTIGYFCLRCHAPVATTVGLRRDQPIWDGPRVFREGVTCIACHRVKENYTKTNGERRIEPGDIYDPVYSGSGQTGSQIVSKYADYFKVKTSPDDKRPGQPIHQRAIKFEQISQSDFCMSCHQVAVQPGIKLEVVWDQYRASPAWRDGTECQDCHMGIVPGRAEGFSIGPAAVVDGKAVTAERKHSNHMFYGPGYSIAHPGIFPQNVKSDRWTINEWLMFDWRAGWGTEDFEDAVDDGRLSPSFPAVWQEPDDRYDARDIVEDNLKKLGYKKDVRRQVMENGARVDGPFFQKQPSAGQPLRFHYCVQNTNPGHNMPSGSLGAQPQLWMNVVLINPSGQRVWETGYLDSYGDLADLHSQDVLERKVPLDKQLFNLQTKFLTTNVKGTDREMYLPVNIDFDQLPFIRPAPNPVTVLNHPPFIRMEGHSIPPLGQRKAKYVIPAQLITEPGTYRLSMRLRSRAEPIYFMKFVDATPEMIRMMNEWIVDAHVQSVVFEVN